jgi:lipopolysaccharide export system protein LptA
MKSIFLKTVLFMLLISGLFFAERQGNSEEKSPLKKGPITITSETLSADNKARTAFFEGSVLARTDSAELHADRMLVFYSEDGKVIKIEAEGDVRLIRGQRVMTSDKALYFAEEEKVIFTGSPKATEAGNVVTGTKITYMIKEDRSIVEHSRVFIKSE